LRPDHSGWEMRVVAFAMCRYLEGVVMHEGALVAG
jgi:hypothetical protein